MRSSNVLKPSEKYVIHEDGYLKIFPLLLGKSAIYRLNWNNIDINGNIYCIILYLYCMTNKHIFFLPVSTLYFFVFAFPALLEHFTPQFQFFYCMFHPSFGSHLYCINIPTLTEIILHGNLLRVSKQLVHHSNIVLSYLRLMEPCILFWLLEMNAGPSMNSFLDYGNVTWLLILT